MLSRAALLLCMLLCAHAHSIDKSLHRERAKDGAFAARGESHHVDDDDHEFDHESILGSAKEAEAYDQLSPEEAKKNLLVLLRKMDTSKDGLIDTKEMHQWILRSFSLLSAEESSERFDDTDADENGFVTWAEHVSETYGDGGDLDGDDETQRMVGEDRSLFNIADANKDGKLDEDEFLAFSHPEEDARMVPLLVDQALAEKDTDKDGRLSFKEYITAQHKGEEQDDEGLLVEKEHFDEDYDKDGDGYLDRSEITAWLVPDNADTATTETEHLFESADADGDGAISYAEALDKHEVFVGSEATDYGEHLSNLHRFEDEL